MTWYSRPHPDREVTAEFHRRWDCRCAVCGLGFRAKSPTANTWSPACRAKRTAQLKARAKAGKKKAA